MLFQTRIIVVVWWREYYCLILIALLATRPSLSMYSYYCLQCQHVLFVQNQNSENIIIWLRLCFCSVWFIFKSCRFEWWSQKQNHSSYFKISKHSFSYWKCPLKGLFCKFQNMLIPIFLSHFSKNWAHFYKTNFSFSFRIHLRIFRFWLKTPRN